MEIQMLIRLVVTHVGSVVAFPEDKAHFKCTPYLLVTKLSISTRKYILYLKHASLNLENKDKIIFFIANRNEYLKIIKSW